MRLSLFAGLPLAALTAFLAAGAASAQESTTRGFSLGLHLAGTSLQVEDAERSSGAGGGLRLGYGFNPTFMIFAQLDGSAVDVRNQPDVEGSWAMGHFDLGARFHFANSSRTWVPYLQGSGGGRAVSVTEVPVTNPLSGGEDITLSGASFSLGGGVLLYPSESLAVDFALLWSKGDFTELTFGSTTVSDVDINAKSTRFNLGISWWP